MNSIDTTEFLQVLAREGELTRAAAERAGWATRVPSCPDWQVTDLVRHVARVHRMAAGVIGGRPVQEAAADTGTEEVPLAELSGWFTEGHQLLVEALREAPEDLQCFTFFEGSPSAREFWVRRQTHETVIHRVDAELAAGGALSSVPAGVAADGIDELLAGFHSLERSQVRSETPVTLRIRAEDVQGAVWTVGISDAAPVVSRDESSPVDCELTGGAEQLYLALWNRLPLPGELKLEGDAAVAELWRTTSGINQRKRD